MSQPAATPLVFVATPCFGGLVTTGYMMSILKLMQHAEDRKFSISVNMLGRDSLITRSRNTLVAQFLAMKEATHLMFIDADIAFEPELVHRMLTFDQDVVGGMYPAKALRWDVPRDIVEREPPQTATLQYVGKLCEPPEFERRGPFATGVYCATGFMMIKRSVFECLIAAHPELAYRSDHVYAPVQGNRPLYAVRMLHRSADPGIPQRGFRFLPLVAGARRQDLARRGRRPGPHRAARLHRPSGASVRIERSDAADRLDLAGAP